MSKKQQQFSGRVDYISTLDAVLIRGDGSHRDLGTISSEAPPTYKKPTLLQQALRLIKGNKLQCGAGLVLGAYAYQQHEAGLLLPLGALVTTAGMNFLATDMASGQASPRISSMNFHDSGTGTTAAAIGDTALQTQAGPATRATGTQSNPTAIQYRSIGTIAYVSTLAITEWGLFNQAASGGTLWDHRIFSAINVVSGDSVAYTYTLTLVAGGS